MSEPAVILLVDARALDDSLLAGFTGWLGAGELARLGRIVRLERRRQFIIGRVLARRALGSVLGVDARALELMDAPGTKPFVRGFEDGADFSISHSGPWVACAASVAGRVGLDIECIDARRNALALAEQAFGAAGAAWLQARPDATRIRDFYARWCAAEARIKLGSDGECVHFEHDALAVAFCSDATGGVVFERTFSF